MKKNNIEILHEEDTFVVVSKPSGLLSIPDRYVAQAPNLKALLQNTIGEIYTVHRLDKDTSGVICFAKTAEAHKSLSEQFSQHETIKFYTAIVEGIPLQKEADIDLPIIEHPRHPGRMTTAKKGMSAHSHYRVVQNWKRHTQLEVQIFTGRTHQIRVHLKAIGHPLLGDALYGRQPQFFLSSIKGKKYNVGKDDEELPLLSRTALHAHFLQFMHPETGEPVRFSVEMPKDLRAVIQQLNKWDL
ncbi:MAG: RluA family pseudouridine synthase [Saprospiraceae bacterium]